MGAELHLHYFSGSFACRVPTWGLPARGFVHGLVAEFAGMGDVPWGRHVARAQLPSLVGDARVLGGRRILGSVERVRLHRKTQHTLQGLAGMGVLSLVEGSGKDGGLRVPGFVTMVQRFRGSDEAHSWTPG